ncbi:Calcium-transporting ATPase 1 [Phytophthora fragariae]|uniref:Calcium-transporting ATPase 1 n=1 Tax=Phytophthora fragariae TaxID=53985 RepID=A0A6A3XXN8_9STRA|nr:Calcium-transporting ATPase 1 [Phytophthora fragariae]KAE8937425.1 Calcium-transporting ATPase 1 [Phytophthora fragariae]KAE9009372.1 Calcium-transporting ATPase 1 [Phytophthora fragariae]KAE9110659.1 Calcium-transporting ATPase 1 [Phytophthora fragariae]KAE9144323.1 Calcium-transporting ATPase 1 [Phytophthora fragariae]
MVDPPDLYGRDSCVDPSELRRASSLQDAAAAEETPPSSSFSYAAAHTPRGARTKQQQLLLNEDDADAAASERSRRSSHRDRFLSDAERLVAMDPRKTRESFAQVDHREDQWAWHEKPVAAILEDFQVHAQRGLDAGAARKRLAQNGPNSLEAETKAPVYVIFLLQFTNVIIGLLMAAAVASIALQEFVEGLAIIAIVTLNAVIATIQEHNASNALEALQKMTSPQCVVLRDGGRQVQIPSEQLVTGDIVVLTTGDIVPADIRLIVSSDFKVNEMILTGESEDVLKKFDADMSRSEKLTADNMVFASTSVATGNATGVVVETGMKTRVGSIAALLKGGSNADGSRPNCWRRFVDKYYPKMTPLQQSLHHLGVVMGTVVLGICVIVFVVGMVRDNADPKNPSRPVWLNMVMVSVSLAVSAVPEGLPMVVTICLSTGTAAMVKKNVLVRKLAAVESLGASSVICTDKTGTLTEGKMTAVKMWSDSVVYDITGTGFNPTGDILRNGVSQTKVSIPVRTTLLSAVLCSNTSLQQEVSEAGAPMWVPMGNSSEAPLVVAAAKAGIWREEAMKTYPRVTEVPFSSTRKMMITVNEVPAGEPHLDMLQLPGMTKFVANVKGAPNYIVQNCTQLLRTDGSVTKMHESDRSGILEAVDDLSSQALRVLAVAIRPLDKLPYAEDEDDVEAKFEALCALLIFVGLVASIDPPREGVKDAIHTARQASIRTVMITGDYLKTAVAIARDIDLLQNGADAETQAVDCGVLRPRQNLYLPDAELDEITSQVSVFARAKPEDKIEIVKSLQHQGHVAAMTGDGVNDAPALKEADIGVAMGIAGTAVAKGASDMILTDDNFCSIVSAVEKGREIYGNIQRFVCFLLSTNFGEITVIFTAIAVGMPNPLEPLQILVLNLFADGMAAVALSLEKGDGTVMSERPRPRSEHIIYGRLWVLVLTNAFLIATGALVVFTCGLYWNFENVLLDDITAGIDANNGDEAYKNVVCSRWMGMGNGWRSYSNCGARDLNGTYLFSDSIRSLDYYESDELLCYGGDYECVSEGTSRSQTMAFIYITTMEMLRAYTARSFTKSVFKDMFSNKWMQMAAVGSITLTLSVTNIPVIMDDLFGFAYIEWYEWMFSMVFALVMVAFGETLKCVYRRRDRGKLRKAAEAEYAGMVEEIRTLRNHIEHLEGKWETEMQQLRIRVGCEDPMSHSPNGNSTLTSSSSSSRSSEEGAVPL